MSHMSTVGVRALKQNASAVVARAAAGEAITITDRGRAVARLVPLSGDRLAELESAGHLRPARRSLLDLEPPATRARGEQPLSAVLDEMRLDERD